MPDVLINFFASSELSDLLIFAAAPFVLLFALDYGIGSPWYTHPLGVLTFLMSLSTFGLLFLILYAMITGNRIDEPWRILVGLGLLVASIGKVIILRVERRRGRIQRRERHAHKNRHEGVNS